MYFPNHALYGNDGSNNYTPVVSTDATVLKTLTTLSVAANEAKLDLTWDATAEASGYLVVRRATSAPTFVPTNGSSYSTGAQGSDTIVYVGTSTSFQDTGLSNGTTYYCDVLSS